MKEENNKKNSKILLIIMAVIFVLILFIVFIVINTKNDSEEVLVIECDKSIMNEKTKILYKMNIYRKDNSLKLVQDSILTFSVYMTDEMLKSIVNYYEYQQNQRIETKFGTNYAYIESSVDYNKQSINSQIIYYVNENSEETIIEAFDYNFISATNEEISNYFEEDGFSCKIY